MSKRYTAEELIAVSCSAWHDRIRREVPPEGITAREILKRVDPWDARWPLIRLLARADRRQLVLWCCDVAQDVRHRITDAAAADAAAAIDAAQRAATYAATDAAADAAVYAASNAAYAAYGTVSAAARQVLRDYLHWLVDRLEGIVPEHPDAATRARAECARVIADARAQAD